LVGCNYFSEKKNLKRRRNMKRMKMQSVPVEVFAHIIRFIDPQDVATFKVLWAVCHNSKRACELIANQVLCDYNNTKLYVWRQVYDVGRRSPGPPDYECRWRVSTDKPDELEIDPRGEKPIIFIAQRHELLSQLKKKNLSHL
jgi:hypothetical protein